MTVERGACLKGFESRPELHAYAFEVVTPHEDLEPGPAAVSAVGVAGFGFEHAGFVSGSPDLREGNLERTRAQVWKGPRARRDQALGAAVSQSCWNSGFSRKEIKS